MNYLQYILPVGMLFLMTFSAWIVARKVWHSLIARGKTMAWIAAIVTFVVSFCGFAVATGILFGVIFGR